MNRITDKVAIQLESKIEHFMILARYAENFDMNNDLEKLGKYHYLMHTIVSETKPYHYYIFKKRPQLKKMFQLLS